MFILYTENEGGEWTPWNTPLSNKEIMDGLWGEGDGGMVSEYDGITSCQAYIERFPIKNKEPYDFLWRDQGPP
jgi:hypothetical protein|tara:strand:+ start:6607 stop:6825 length:219 start_codon:yes stop_codon:yes gene_type:complete